MTTPHAFPLEIIPIVQAQFKFYFLLKVVPWVGRRTFFFFIYHLSSFRDYEPWSFNCVYDSPGSCLLCLTYIWSLFMVIAVTVLFTEWPSSARSFPVIYYLISRNILWRKYHYFPHFTEEKNQDEINYFQNLLRLKA